jgi:predicted transcriptional regulator
VPSKSKSTDPRTIPPLGDLEVAVLEYVWSSGDASAKEAHAALGAARGISLNTVQSAMERLFRKGLLSRVKASHSFRYSARIGREELVATLIGEVLGRFGADSSAALAAFVEAADDLDEAALRGLEAKLRKRRQPGRTK